MSESRAKGCAAQLSLAFWLRTDPEATARQGSFGGVMGILALRGRQSLASIPLACFSVPLVVVAEWRAVPAGAANVEALGVECHTAGAVRAAMLSTDDESVTHMLSGAVGGGQRHGELNSINGHSSSCQLSVLRRIRRPRTPMSAQPLRSVCRKQQRLVVIPDGSPILRSD
ncbi:uncharacterized protein J3D65DRAFT_625606 [Phyllosticta citribraziliensis]|uniref:Uncharacterized protein n=1 Tax=Phyllosticta citribraziliensis TaxID=989973 RepID=A0ABR1LSD1_9PEZI